VICLITAKRPARRPGASLKKSLRDETQIFDPKCASASVRYGTQETP
jgi:hypothetical protein